MSLFSCCWKEGIKGVHAYPDPPVVLRHGDRYSLPCMVSVISYMHLHGKRRVMVPSSADLLFYLITSTIDKHSPKLKEKLIYGNLHRRCFGYWQCYSLLGFQILVLMINNALIQTKEKEKFGVERQNTMLSLCYFEILTFISEE
ncbi:hypothetical protein ACJX0J_007441, partial [Zea mays]